jgi:hypothetical protein
MHAHWYLRFRRFKMEALDLRRSSNRRRSLYVALSWGGWKDPLGIIVGGVDLGGIASRRPFASRSPSPRVRGFLCDRRRRRGEGEEGTLSPSVTTCGGDQKTSIQDSSYDLAASALSASAVAADPHAVHRPGNRRGGSSLRFSRRGLQKLHRALGKTKTYRRKSLLTFGSVDLGE